MSGVVWKRAGRVFIVALVVMVVVTFVGIVSVARELSTLAHGSAEFAPLGLPMLVGSRNESVSTLQPQPGLGLVIVVPLLAAALTVLVSTRVRPGGSEEKP
ncbi:MAG TPA: hypothetical protein VGK28_11595 [Candidatus Dormibacteraeota bacterium]